MKKKFTFLIAALMLLTMILPGKAVGQTTLTTGDLDFGTPQFSENFNSLSTTSATATINSDSQTAYGIFNKMYNNNTGNTYAIASNNTFGSNVLSLSAGSGSPLIASITKSGGSAVTFGTTGAFSVKVAKTDVSYFGLYAADDNNAFAKASGSVFIQNNAGALSINNGNKSNYWVSIGSYTSNDIIEICVIYNNTNSSATYGGTISLASKKAHIYVNGTCVMDGENPKAFTIPGSSLTVFRVLPQATSGNKCTVDDVKIYNSLPTAASSDPTITVSPTSLTGFTYSHGNGPSEAQSFTVSGTNLTANISITAPTDYEIRQGTTGDFGNSISLTPSNGTVSSTTIYARLKSGLAIGNYNSENVSLTSTNATTKTVALSGNVTGYTVTYDGNGETSGEVPTDGTSYTYNATVTVKSNSGNLAKDHYNFSGWNTQPDGNGTNYTAGTGTFNITANTTLYAKWTPITHTFSTAVTPDNSGTVVAKDGGDNTIASGSSVAETAQLTLTASPAEGYNFTSWSDGGNNSTLSSTTTNPTTFTMGTANVTITATFTARTPATVTLHDGLNGATETEVNTYTDATFAEVIEGHDIASVNGWTALGWVKSYTSGTPTLITTSEAVGETEHLYAVYSKGSNIFTLINDVNDISINGNYMIGYDSKIMKNVKSTYYMGYTTSNEISDGSFEYVDGRVFILGGTTGAYTFYDGSKYLSATGGSSYADNLGLSENATTNYEKWSIGFSNNTAQITNNGNTSYMVAFRTGNSYDYFNCYTSTSVNLYKQTSSVNYSITPSAEKCHVTYNANGATSGDVPVDNNEYEPSDVVTVLGNNGNLAKMGHTWNGWNTDAEGNGDSYNAGGEFTITANTTLYAQWTINEYSYTLIVDDNSEAELEVDGSPVAANAKIQYNKEVTVNVDVTDGYAYHISVINEATSEAVTVTNDKFNMPASAVTVTVTSRLLCKYVLVTSDEQLVAGKHYVIANGTSGTAYAMGYQNTNNRPQSAAVTFSSGKIVEAGDIWDFVLSGDATNGWTLYDKYTDGEGFLYAASSSNNNLKLQTTLDSNGKWDISFANNIASIVAKGSYTHKYMRYNSGSSLFSCYESGKQSDIYLYVKEDDTDYEIYSETPMSGLQTITSLVVEDKLTIQNGAILTVTGTIDNDNPANLIIEDGGQFIVNNSGVQATVKKALPEATSSKDENWTTISSPVKNISIGDTDEDGNVTHLKDVAYALYRLNETTSDWENYKNTNYHDGLNNDDFETFEAGRGYLYSRTSLTTLEYVGEVNGDEYTEYTLTMSGNKISGFHLIGNPYSHDIYKGDSGDGCAIPNTAETGYYNAYELATGFYQLKNGTSWEPKLDDGTKIEKGEGILVQATTEGVLRIYNSTTAPTKANAINHDNIMFTVANGQNEDAAYALFDKGMGLSKINHRDNVTPMIYIEQKGEDYAIATMSDDTKSFNLNFKAMTTGQYTLSYKANGDFNYLHVIDRLTGEDVDMLLEGEYKFIGTPSDKDNRFIVKLGYMPDYSDADNEIFAYQSGSDILVSGTGELQIFDVTGRQVMTTTINGAESISVPAQGVYIFRLVGNEIKTQKIVVR